MSPSASYPGVYAARVQNNNDPSSQNRIQMLIPQIFGATPVAIWAPPVIPPETPPAVGSTVWCIFQGGDPAHPTYLPSTGVIPDNVYPNLPPPVTSGGLHTYTDEAQVVWVAKPGVNGGNWRQARDVLHARVYRLAAWTVSSTASPITFDNLYYDAYGIWDHGTKLIALIPGMWEYHATVSVTYGVNNYSIWAQAYLNGVRADFATTGPSAGGWQSAHVGGVWNLNTNDYFQMYPVCQGVTSLGGGGGNDLTHAEFHWKATG